MYRIIIFVVSMNLQLSDEAFCALSQGKYVPSLNNSHVLPETTQKGMKLKDLQEKQKEILHDSTESLKSKENNNFMITNRASIKKRKILGRNKSKVLFKLLSNSNVTSKKEEEELNNRSDYKRIITKPLKLIKRKKIRNKTERKKLSGRKKSKEALTQLGHSLRNIDKRIRSQKKSKNINSPRYISRSKLRKDASNSYRSGLKQDLRQSSQIPFRRQDEPPYQVMPHHDEIKKNNPEGLPYSFLKKNISYTRATFLPGVTIPAWVVTPPKYTLGVRMTPVLFHHCNITRDTCIRSYQTGIICARTVYYSYNTFDDYCVMDYVNCRDGFDFWQAIHPGPCIKIEPYSEYMHYPYQDDYFIDRDFIIEDIF